jgi:hypothetical protein
MTGTGVDALRMNHRKFATAPLHFTFVGYMQTRLHFLPINNHHAKAHSQNDSIQRFATTRQAALYLASNTLIFNYFCATIRIRPGFTGDCHRTASKIPKKLPKLRKFV